MRINTSNAQATHQRETGSGYLLLKSIRLTYSERKGIQKDQQKKRLNRYISEGGEVEKNAAVTKSSITAEDAVVMNYLAMVKPQGK